MANIGEPQRTIEVVPLQEPVPAPSVPDSEPSKIEEPTEVPAHD